MNAAKLEATRDESAIVVPIARVRISGDMNARKNLDPTAFRELRDSIERRGLLEPIMVLPDEAQGVWWVVGGHRRFLACHELGHETIRATVSTATTLQAALLENLAENVGRDDLGGAELADRLLMMRRTYKMTAKDLAKDVGLSVAHVDNLCRIRAKVVEGILLKWRLYPDIVSSRDMAAYAALPEAEQWAAYVADYGAGDVPQKKERKKAAPKPSKPSLPQGTSDREDDAPASKDVQTTPPYLPLSERIIYLDTVKGGVCVTMPRTLTTDLLTFCELTRDEAADLARSLLVLVEKGEGGDEIKVSTPPPGHPEKNQKRPRRAGKGKTS